MNVLDDNDENGDLNELELILLRENKIHNLKKFFKLNSYKITTISIILALNICLTLISIYLFQGFAILGFLRYEISFISYLICVRVVNWFYACLLVVISSWLRFLGLDPNAEWVGVLMLNLSELFAIIVYTLVLYGARNFLKDKKFETLAMFIIGFAVSFLTAIWSIMLNFTFILDLYDKFFGNSSGVFLAFKTWWFAGILMGFNLSKYFFNFLIFLSIYKPLNKIVKNSNL